MFYFTCFYITIFIYVFYILSICTYQYVLFYLKKKLIDRQIDIPNLMESILIF